MRAVVQRAKAASVRVDGKIVGQIAHGLVTLVGIETTDGPQDAAYLIRKLPNLRIFSDEAGVPNRSLLQTGGSILLISQFTLLGDARKGNRPSYLQAANGAAALPLYEALIRGLLESVPVETGVFGADMAVELINDGPFTILLDSRKEF